jgi:hypothetical protein
VNDSKPCRVCLDSLDVRPLEVGSNLRNECLGRRRANASLFVEQDDERERLPGEEVEHWLVGRVPDGECTRVGEKLGRMEESGGVEERLSTGSLDVYLERNR